MATSQLRDVLIFLVRTFQSLPSSSNSLFPSYLYILGNLHDISTSMLTRYLPPDDAGQVICALLKIAMEIANGEEWRNELRERRSRDKVIGLLTEMISEGLGDVDQISLEVLDILFFYLIEPQKLNCRESYTMSRRIIQLSQTSLGVAIQSLLAQSLLAGSFPDECELIGRVRLLLDFVRNFLVSYRQQALQCRRRQQWHRQLLLTTQRKAQLHRGRHLRVCLRIAVSGAVLLVVGAKKNIATNS
ncbi:unnamed protein product [Cylicocyclus nassatus]|uniref:Uncharacterized protein n=1 Tax=Cylicocyclus nassatus TaxID=53992 RepID=A0AA36MGZ4_CYLNA|nr:unnamed protein product [Cylicocyclus nassatus]